MCLITVPHRASSFVSFICLNEKNADSSYCYNLFISDKETLLTLSRSHTIGKIEIGMVYSQFEAHSFKIGLKVSIYFKPLTNTLLIMETFRSRGKKKSWYLKEQYKNELMLFDQTWPP